MTSHFNTTSFTPARLQPPLGLSEAARIQLRSGSIGEGHEE